MTLNLTLDCGCCITLVSDGDQHRPTSPQPCPRHLLVVGTMLIAIGNARVRVGFVDDGVPVTR